MKTMTKDLAIDAINKCEKQIDAINKAYEIGILLVDDVKYASENGMFDLYKKQKGYGTWSITAFVNQSYFEDYSEFLKKFNITTHEEDYDINNLISDIEDYIKENIFDWFGSDERSEF